MVSYVPGNGKRPPLGVRFRNNDRSLWMVEEDNGIIVTLRQDDDGKQQPIEFSGPGFDSKWRAIEDVFEPDKYLYRFIPEESPNEIVDSGASLRELPHVGQLVHLSKPGVGPITYKVYRVLDRTNEPSSGGQARCDLWVRQI